MEAMFEIIIQFSPHTASSRLELSAAHSLLFVTLSLCLSYYRALMINPEGKSLSIKPASKALHETLCV